MDVSNILVDSIDRLIVSTIFDLECASDPAVRVKYESVHKMRHVARRECRKKDCDLILVYTDALIDYRLTHKEREQQIFNSIKRLYVKWERDQNLHVINFAKFCKSQFEYKDFLVFEQIRKDKQNGVTKKFHSEEIINT